MYKKFLLLILCCSLLIISGCNKGIEPEPVSSNVIGFSGKITFTGTWPIDVLRTHLVVFKNDILSVDDFSFLNLAFASYPIPSGSKEFSYTTMANNYFNLTLGEGTCRYIVVAQSKTALLSFDRADWVIVGVYYNIGDKSKPGIMTLRKGYINTGIDINVDFDNLPPQPPK